MPKVSVIIPIYGVEKYIERCARSLFEQTLDDIEYIFVNDCTNDRSIDILNDVISEYPARQKNVIIASHEKNKGLPVARQTGLKKATGEYIIHCDSDDWVTPQAYELLYEKAIEENADIVISNFFVSDGNKHHPFYGTLSLDMHDLMFRYINIWTHLVKRRLYQNPIIYPKGNMFEDKVVTIQLAVYAKNISILNEPLYYYFCNPSSICRVFSKDKCLDRFEQAVNNVNIIIQFLESKSLTEAFIPEIVRLKYEARHQIAPYLNDKSCYQLWKSCYPEINKYMLYGKGIKTSERVRFILSYIRLFSYIR